MKSKTTTGFRKALITLPQIVQERAKQAYELFKDDPFHNSLQFKLIDADEGLYSVRIGLHYRALGRRKGETITWSWIGTHAEYDKMI